jgi:hypothetical protein
LETTVALSKPLAPAARHVVAASQGPGAEKKRTAGADFRGHVEEIMEKQETIASERREAERSRERPKKPDLTSRYKELGIASVRAAAPYCSSGGSQDEVR